MLHYHTIILQSGPPRNFWCFRYEAKHKDFKTYARSITSRTNICVSLAKQIQLQFANSCMHPREINNVIVKLCHETISSHQNIVDLFCNNNKITTSYIAYSQCIYKSKLFKRGLFVCQYNDIDIINAIIFEILEIIVFEGLSLPCVICKLKKFSNHLSVF